MYVYHGASVYKEKAIPIRHKRTRKGIDGKQHIIFDDLSFHASASYWIALAYTYSVKTFILSNKEVYYNVSIDLYSDKKVVTIHGYNSLKQSLTTLYGNGGYIHKFYNNSFFHTDGLGSMECITQDIVYPKSIEHIHNPVEKMKSLGVSFRFIDLALEKNQYKRNYNTPLT